jgi:hypothetical protein
MAGESKLPGFRWSSADGNENDPEHVLKADRERNCEFDGVATRQHGVWNVIVKPVRQRPHRLRMENVQLGPWGCRGRPHSVVALANTDKIGYANESFRAKNDGLPSAA